MNIALAVPLMRPCKIYGTLLVCIGMIAIQVVVIITLLTGGERGMNGNGTGDEWTTVLCVRIQFHFNFPVPVLSAQARLHAYYTIYMYYTFTHVAE